MRTDARHLRLYGAYPCGQLGATTSVQQLARRVAKHTSVQQLARRVAKHTSVQQLARRVAKHTSEHGGAVLEIDQAHHCTIYTEGSSAARHALARCPHHIVGVFRALPIGTSISLARYVREAIDQHLQDLDQLRVEHTPSGASAPTTRSTAP